MLDLSVVIIGYKNHRLVRQTLKGIRRVSPGVSHEILLVENDPSGATTAMAREFPEVRVVDERKNVGFGRGMNRGFQDAKGRYVMVFNPDVVVTPGSFEKLVAYLDAHPDVGMVGPRLMNPDGTLQHSCYTFMTPATVLARRLPFVRRLARVRKHLDRYTMADWDHAQTRDVDYLLGAAILVRRSALDAVGARWPCRRAGRSGCIPRCTGNWRHGSNAPVPSSRSSRPGRRRVATTFRCATA